MSTLLRTSIRARVIAGLSIMLFPLAMVSIGAFFFLEKAIRFLQEIEEEIIEEVLPTARIRQLLARAYMPANDYIIHGNPNERETFESLAQEVDEAFDDVLAGSLDIPEEGRLLLQA